MASAKLGRSARTFLSSLHRMTRPAPFGERVQCASLGISGYYYRIAGESDQMCIRSFSRQPASVIFNVYRCNGGGLILSYPYTLVEAEARPIIKPKKANKSSGAKNLINHSACFLRCWRGR